MNNRIFRALRDLDDPSLIRIVISCMIQSSLSSEEDSENSFYETTAIPSYIMSTGGLNAKQIWIDEFEKIYPKHVLIHADSASINQKLTIKARGFDSISIHNELVYAFLTNRGIRNLISVLGSDFVYDFTMDWDHIDNFVNAVEIVQSVYEDYSDVIDYIGIFDDDDEDSAIFGMTTSVKMNPEDPNSGWTKLMLISRAHAEHGSVQEIIGTLIHEWDHYRTSIGDGDIEGRMFRSIADKRIGELVYENWVLNKMGENSVN